MLENLMEQISTEKDKLIDKYTLDLLTLAGIEVNNRNNNFELLLASDELKRRGYEIKFIKSTNNSDVLCLLKNNKIVCGYEFNVRIKDNCVKLITTSIE